MAKRKRNSKGKRHQVHAESLFSIADQLNQHAGTDHVDMSSGKSILKLLADIIAEEGKRVAKIVR